jgi:WD40 repeat protein
VTLSLGLNGNITNGLSRIWEIASRQPVTGGLKHYGGDFGYGATWFSPNGKWLIFGEAGGGCQVWDAGSGDPILGLPADQNLRSMRFNANGSRAALLVAPMTASPFSQITVRIVDARTGALVSEFETNAPIRDTVFSPDGNATVTLLTDGRVRMWATETGEQLADFSTHSGPVSSAEFSPNGGRLITVNSYKEVREWEAKSGRQLCEPLQHDAGLSGAHFGPGGKLLLTSTVRQGQTVWGPVSARAFPLILRHNAVTNRQQAIVDWGKISASFDESGSRILTIAQDDQARVWDARTGRLLRKLVDPGGEIISAEFSPEGRRVATSSENSLCFWDLDQGRLIAGPITNYGRTLSMEFSANGSRLLTLTCQRPAGEYTAQVWDATTGLPATKPLRFQVLYAVEFSPDGLRFLTLSSDGSRVWSADSGQPLTKFFGSHLPLRAGRFSPDGLRVLSPTSPGHPGQEWDARTGLPLGGNPPSFWEMITAPSKAGAFNAAFSRDATRIVSILPDQTAQAWDASTGRFLTVPLKHTEPIRVALFSPDGSHILTAAGNTARVWDVQTSQPLTDPLLHPATLRSARFSPDGKRIVTACEDGSARVWDLAPGATECPDWLIPLAEAVSGDTVNAQGIVEANKENRAGTIQEIRRQLLQMPPTDDWTVWGQWFFADQEKRTASAFASIPLPEGS